MKTLTAIAVGAAILLTAGAAAAHHSGAMFDSMLDVKAQGTVKELQWTNPHGWLQVMIPNAQGVELEWSLELTSPNSLRRFGWNATTLKPGDKVTVDYNPLRDGKPGGRLLNVILPNGTILNGQGAVR